MNKSVIRIVCFISLLLIVLLGINNVLKFKYSDGIYDLTKFYELNSNSVDVLILGSSHAFEDINTGVLWNEYGMASYILGGSKQPLWNTYYYLKEALKSQTPELIILEGYMLCNELDYMDDSTIIKNNFGLKWSIDKIESIIVSSSKERWMEFFLEYEQYHNRYMELSDVDFLVNQGNELYCDWKGFGCNMDTYQAESIDVTYVNDRTPLHEKTEKYYRMIIELAQEKDIPIVIVVSPYANITIEDQEMYNMAGDIAEEYDVEFVNYNLYIQDIGIDYSCDAADASHLNYIGNKKYTLYLGRYICENYDVSDRRNDNRYDSWQRSADYIEKNYYK